MASVFGHTAVALTAAKGFDTFSTKREKVSFWLLSVLCSVFPDSDMIAFNFGIPYEHMFGHRGFSHSLLFGCLFGAMMAWIYTKLNPGRKMWPYWCFFGLLTISHGILDAMTTGGRGIGFFIPFIDERYFLPFRPLLVSPLGAARFFSEWGMKVIISEFMWLGLPCLFIWIWTSMLKPRYSRVSKQTSFS